MKGKDKEQWARIRCGNIKNKGNRPEREICTICKIRDIAREENKE